MPQGNGLRPNSSNEVSCSKWHLLSSACILVLALFLGVLLLQTSTKPSIGGSQVNEVPLHEVPAAHDGHTRKPGHGSEPDARAQSGVLPLSSRVNEVPLHEVPAAHDGHTRKPGHGSEPDARAQSGVLPLSSRTFDQKVVIDYSRMLEEMQQDAVNVAFLALTKYNTVRAVASYIKEAFENKYPAAWQCVVEHHFSPLVDFRDGNFIHFKLGQTTILLFRAT